MPREVVDPEAPRSGRAATHVFFGATVRYANAAGADRVVSIVGVDEVDLDRNYISWLSPLARALMKSGPGDCVVLHAPSGTEQLQILEVRYERVPVEPFREPPGAEAAPKAGPYSGPYRRGIGASIASHLYSSWISRRSCGISAPPESLLVMMTAP